MSVYPPVVNYPRNMIVQTDDLLDYFHSQLAIPISAENQTELLTQIAMVLLNEAPHCVSFANLPEWDKIRKNDALWETRELLPGNVERSLLWLAEQILARLGSMGAFAQGDFPYAFEKMLGNDIVFFHVPY